MKDHKFLKRPDSEEKMYADMENEYDDEKDSDEDNIINDLESKMVLN